MASLRYLCTVGGVLCACLAVPIPGRPADDPDDKVHGHALDSTLKRGDWPPECGVQLKATKAEVVERDGRKVLRVHWAIEYTGKRWPLVILEPSLDRDTDRQTRLAILARGKSGEGYSWTAHSRRPVGVYLFESHSELDWFLEVPKEAGKAEGVIELDFDEAKNRFVKQMPDEFSADVTPALYVRLHHRPRDRAEHLQLDAWAGELSARAIKVTIDKW